ncbi:MAG: DUF6209 family protein [Myxococcota bacterium]
MNRLLWLAVLLSGCGVQEAVLDEGAADDFEASAEAPLLGADGRDAAERGCNVVLRTLERGAVSCPGGVCWWTWTGVLDVSRQAVSEGARPRVLFKNVDAAQWSSVSATRISGAPTGFVRYRFRLASNTVRDGMSATAYGRASVQVAPFLLARSGARLFDHNRLPGELETYVLQQAGGWRVGDDAAICVGDVVAPRALDFQSGFRTQQRGALVAGQEVTLTYALDRLATCRGTHNGAPAWDLRGYVRFNPSGAVVDGTVRGFDAPNGVPSTSAHGVPWTVTIPAGTTSLEVWFHNSTGAGSTCEAYDSNFGANYRFPVSAVAPARVEWVGNAGSSFSRACSRVDGAPASVTMDSYLQQRACAFVEVDVYVPGLTDAAGEPQPGALFAQAETKRDGVSLPATVLSFVGRVGNDWRFHYEVPKSDLFFGPKWERFEYGFRFSTDGRVWKREAGRQVVRDASFCNPAWGGC